MIPKPKPYLITLASLGFKILFSDDKIIKAHNFAFPGGLEPTEEHLRFNEFVQRNSLLVSAQLPFVLIGMTFSVFWTKFIIYETDSGCNPNDLSLECFTNSSGPLPCGVVLELKNSTYVCYN